MKTYRGFICSTCTHFSFPAFCIQVSSREFLLFLDEANYFWSPLFYFIFPFSLFFCFFWAEVPSNEQQTASETTFWELKHGRSRLPAFSLPSLSAPLAHAYHCFVNAGLQPFNRILLNRADWMAMSWRLPITFKDLIYFVMKS